MTTSFPQIENNTLYCKTVTESKVDDVARLDSAIYVQPDGTKIAYFVFENEIPTATNITVRIRKNYQPISVQS